MTELLKALRKWETAPMRNGGTCCGYSHFKREESGLFTDAKDIDVCVRELAWREYVRMRDANPTYPFNKREKRGRWYQN